MNRRIAVLAVFCLLTMALLSALPIKHEYALWDIPEVKAATLFTANFESGWDFSGNTTTGGSMKLSTDWAAFGSYSGFFNITNANAQLMTYNDLPSSYNLVFMRMYVNITSWSISQSGSRLGLLALNNRSNGFPDKQLELGVYGTSKYIYIRYNNGSNYNVVSATTWSLDTQYYVELMLNLTTNEIAVWRDGVNIADLNTTFGGYLDMINSVTVGNVNGYPTGDEMTFHADQVKVAESYIGVYTPTDTPQIVYDYQSPWVNSTRAGNVTQFRVKLTCDGPLHYGILETNSSGTPTNETATPLSGASDTFLYNLTISSNVGDVIQWKGYFNASVTGNWNSTTYQNFTVTSAYGHWLYVDGSELRLVADDSVIKLKGTNIALLNDYENGSWSAKGETWTQGHNDISETRVKDRLRAMQCWGMNAIRMHGLTCKWYQNSSDHRNVFYNVTDWAQDLGMYVIVDPFAVLPYPEGAGQNDLPYPPHDDGDGVFTDAANYLEFWKNVTDDLCSFPNIIFEPFNEAGGDARTNSTARDEWVHDVIQPIIDYTRSYCDAPVIVHWGYGCDGLHDPDWMLDYNLLGKNVLYSVHFYPYSTIGAGNDYDDYPQTYSATFTWMNTTRLFYKFVDADVHVVLGEIGYDNWATGVNRNYTYNFVDNFVKVALDWNYSVFSYNWRPTWRLAQIKGDTSTTLQHAEPLYDYGVHYIQSINSLPFGFSVGNELLSGEPYIYSNNTSWSSSWDGENLTVSYLSSSMVKIFFNARGEYPINSTLQCLHSNGTLLNATDYYNTTNGLIWLNSVGSGTWKIGYSLTEAPPPPPTNKWQMTFRHRDRDLVVIDSYVTWKLYNGSQLLTYTEGQYSLTDGTYTLKTYYLSLQINSTSLPTATYGNTTINIDLEMEEWTTGGWLLGLNGYVAFNRTVSTFTWHNNSTNNVTFTVTGGAGSIRIIVATTHNISWVIKDGTPQSGWTYSQTYGYVTIVSSGFSKWQFERVQYYFTFNHKDKDNLAVDSKITWKLYNGSELVSYTESSVAIENGTYTLKTYRRGWLINTTSLATVTHGNSSINILLNAKQYTYGYIFFNNTISAITINVQNASHLNFTVTGSSPSMLIIDVVRNATIFQRNAVNLTGWEFNVIYSYIIYNASTLSNYYMEFGITLGNPYFTLTLFFAATVTASGGVAVAFWYRRSSKTRSISIS